jgi:hypothetical protein
MRIPLPARLRGRRIWMSAGVLLASLLLVLVVIQSLLAHSGPQIRRRVILTLSHRLGSRVELDSLTLSLWRGRVSGGGLRVFTPASETAASGAKPMLEAHSFTFDSSLLGLLRNPMTISSVHVSGLTIVIPPRPAGFVPEGGGISSERRTAEKPDPIRADEIVCDGTEVILLPQSAQAEPRRLMLKSLILRHVEPDQSWPYEAVLLNDAPRGEVRSAGRFGPWVMESPVDSPLSGRFNMTGAALNSIRGLGGELTAQGQFSGTLDNLSLTGTAEAPHFSLSPANRPIALLLKFSGKVDGASGITTLDPIEARIGESVFRGRGTVLDERGQGHRIAIDAKETGGRLEDFLTLAVHPQPVLMNGAVSSRVRMQVVPGEASVAEKMTLTGSFEATALRFTSASVRDMVNQMSQRAQGDSTAANSTAANFGSPQAPVTLAGDYRMAGGTISMSGLVLVTPGARLDMAGTVRQADGVLSLQGQARTESSLSGMETSWWKKLLLLPVDPFFHRKGAGAQVPIQITGKGNELTFGIKMKPGD